MSIAFIDEIKVTDKSENIFRGYVHPGRKWEVTVRMTVYAESPEVAREEAYFALLPHTVENQVKRLVEPSPEELNQSTWPDKERTGH